MPSAVWNQYTDSPELKMEFTSLPVIRAISVVTTPSVANRENAREKMITQLMKLGSVVKVCTTLRTGPHLISLSSMAKNMGSGVSTIPITAKIKVFFSVLTTLASLKISRK